MFGFEYCYFFDDAGLLNEEGPNAASQIRQDPGYDIPNQFAYTCLVPNFSSLFRACVHLSSENRSRGQYLVSKLILVSS